MRQVCVGLVNRDVSVAGAAYTFGLDGDRDAQWLEATGNNRSGFNSDITSFLKRCIHGDATHPPLAKVCNV